MSANILNHSRILFNCFTLLQESVSSVGPALSQTATPMARWLATLIRAWKRCQITFKSLWMPELLLPNPPRLFNLTVLLQVQDKMVNPCSGGLSERSTHSLEHGISLQIPSAHFRCDPITARICVFHFLPSPYRHVIRIPKKKKKSMEEVFLNTWK